MGNLYAIVIGRTMTYLLADIKTRTVRYVTRTCCSGVSYPELSEFGYRIILNCIFIVCSRVGYIDRKKTTARPKIYLNANACLLLEPKTVVLR